MLRALAMRCAVSMEGFVVAPDSSLKMVSKVNSDLRARAFWDNPLFLRYFRMFSCIDDSVLAFFIGKNK